VKQCIAGSNKTKDECLAAWTTCIVNASADGDTSIDDYTTCQTKIGGGNTEDATPPDTGEDAVASTCAIDGIGWIICPVVSFMAKIVDAAYDMVASLLAIQPLMTTGGTAGVYNAWSIMRNFANVAFVIAFLVIIFSQVTSFGITNYGIKKMLPRLIIAAVLVNISYWLCAAAVDISNILGSSLREIFNGIGASIKPPDNLTSAQTGKGWEGLSAVVLTGTAVAGIGLALYIGLSAFIPILIAVLFAIVTVFLVLALRQALVILLIVVAPLAFVAYLLPNTESLFKKWRDLLKTLLLMYPIIALIFGASALASQVIMTTAGGTEAQEFVVEIMGAGVAIIPLAITPVVMKTTGSVLNRFGGAINNPSKGPFDRAKNAAEGYRKNRQQLRDARALNRGRRFGGSVVRRQARRAAVLKQRERNYNNANAKYIADTSLSNDVSNVQKAVGWATAGEMGNRTRGDQFVGEMARGGGEPQAARSAALAQAITVQAKIEAEEVTAASAVIKNMNLDRNQEAMRQLSQGNAAGGLSSTHAMRTAAMQNVVNSHDITGVNQLLDNVRSMDEKTRESFADSLANSKERPQYVGQTAISEIRQHDGITTIAKNSTQLVATAIDNNTYSVDKIANGDREELQYVLKIAQDSTVRTNNKQLKANAKTAMTDTKYAGQISKNAGVVEDISNLRLPLP
jgi:hypothetical protein